MDISILLGLLGAIAGSATVIEKIIDLRKFVSRKKNYENIFIINNKIHHEFYASHKDIIKIRRKIILKDADFENVNNVKFAYEKCLNKEINELKIEINPIPDEKTLYKFLDTTVEIKNDHSRKLIFNSGLMSSLVQNYLSATDKKSIDRSTIVGIMLGKKISKYTKAFTCLFAGLALHMILVLLNLQQVNLTLIGILLLFISALSLNQKMLEYRIKRGYYGTNGYEVKEIVQFIQEHSDKTDFIDKNGTKKLLPAPEERIVKEEVVYGEVYS